MTKVKVRAGKGAVTQAQEGGDYGDPPPVGLYHLELKGLDQKTAKGANGGKYLSCRWQPIAAGREGEPLDKKLGSVWDVVSFSEDSEWARARFALALGAQPNRAGNVDLDVELDATKPGSPIGTVVLGRVKADKDLEGNYKPAIGWIGPLNAPTEDSEEFADDEEEVGEEVDEEEATEDFGEEDELLTEDILADYNNKELAALLTEFDLDKAALTVKVKGKVNVDKTRTKMIAAILEAQGADEEDDDEDPF